MWCVGTLSSEDDGRQTFRHLNLSFRQSVQDNPLGFCRCRYVMPEADQELHLETSTDKGDDSDEGDREATDAEETDE